MKLNEAIIYIRVELQDSSLKKSGKNKFAGFQYYELSDFLPKLNELMLGKKMNDVFTIEDGVAALTLKLGDEVQTYRMPFVMFDTPLNKNGQPSMQAIQYLGALNTYYKRYLYLNAFGITDGEVIDGMDNAHKSEVKKVDNSKVSAKQVKLIQTRISQLKIDEDTVSMLKTHYNIESWNDLPATAMEGLIDWFTKRETA